MTKSSVVTGVLAQAIDGKHHAVALRLLGV
jgi:hypothetical protein